MRPNTPFAFALFLALIGCSAPPPPNWDGHGRVFDVSTGKPMPGAFVVGRYVGTMGAHGATSCNRVEVVQANSEGYFEFPIDSNHGSPIISAYAPGYEYSYSPRTAENGVRGNASLWQVVLHERKKGADFGKVLAIEPTVFKSEREAQESSREWRDAFLLPTADDNAARALELSRVAGQVSCGGGTQSPLIAMAFLKQVYEEQFRVSSPPAFLSATQKLIVGFDANAPREPKAQ